MPVYPELTNEARADIINLTIDTLAECNLNLLRGRDTEGLMDKIKRCERILRVVSVDAEYNIGKAERVAAHVHHETSLARRVA